MLFKDAIKMTFQVNRVTHPCDPSKWLYVMADVPHLVKNLRSMLCKHDITLSQAVVEKFCLPSDTVSIKPLEALANFQGDLDLKLAPKFHMGLLHPKHFNKMKVSHAMNVFSMATASGLNFLVEQENFPAAFKTTAWFILQVNHWFDLMSSRHPVLALSKEKPEKFEEAVKFLSHFAEMIGSCKFGVKGDWKPVQSGIRLSTQSILQLCEDVLSSSPFLLTSRFTQDCLENLFSSIRFKNPVPTPLELKRALKLISVGQFLKAASTGGYKVDDSEYLADFLSVHPVVSSPEEEFHEVVICEFTSSPALSVAEEASLYYLAGYCVQSLNKQHQLCPICLCTAQLEATVDLASISSLTCLKEYRQHALFHCSVDVFFVCRAVEHVIRQLQPSLGNRLQISKSSILNNCENSPDIVATSFPECHDFKAKLLAKFVNVRLQIICKQLRTDQRKCQQGFGLGSRSTAMREFVKKV